MLQNIHFVQIINYLLLIIEVWINIYLEFGSDSFGQQSRNDAILEGRYLGTVNQGGNIQNQPNQQNQQNQPNQPNQNKAPQFVGTLSSLNANQCRTISYILPNVNDPEGDSFTITATLMDRNPLPSWILFDSRKLTIQFYLLLLNMLLFKLLIYTLLFKKSFNIIFFIVSPQNKETLGIYNF